MLSLVDTLSRTEQKINRWEIAPLPAIDNDTIEPCNQWLPAKFPALFNKPLSNRHIELGDWFTQLEQGHKPPAFFAIWPRAGGKSTTVEGGVVYTGAMNKRRFCLYVRSIQDKANESVQNISSMLESGVMSREYPRLSERKLGKYGNSKGWKVNTLRCANGFNVVALGFDAAVRGIKIEEYRPDLIVLDDIDGLDDSLEVTKKKIDILTKSILPTGSDDVAVVGIQNLIKWNGIFHRIASGKADFLLDRQVSGPYPAVEGLGYDRLDTGKYRIIKGEATWEGQSIPICESQMNDWGIEAFLHEAQHDVSKKTGRVYHAFTGPGPRSDSLDLSKADGFYHSHDFGAVNHIWGLWAKIGRVYYLVHEAKLPEGTTEARAQQILRVMGDKRVIAGWGGAPSEKQYRLDFRNGGVSIRTPPTAIKSVQEQQVEAQIRLANTMLKDGTMVICEDMVYTIDQLENCVRDDKGGIMDKATWHFLDMIRYFASGVSNQGWVA